MALQEQAWEIKMSAVWIAGIVIVMTVGMFFTLALCRCAALADRGIEGYLPDDEQLRMPSADLNESRDGQRSAYDDEAAPRFSHLSPSS